MRLSIVLTINGIYTKPGILGHRPVHRLSIIGPIVAISWLYFASVYSTICIKSVVIAYKNSYKQPYIFEFLVCEGTTTPYIDGRPGTVVGIFGFNGPYSFGDYGCCALVI